MAGTGAAHGEVGGKPARTEAAPGAHWALLGPTFKAENLLRAPHRLVFTDLTQNFALRTSYFRLVGLLPERLFELHRDLASKLGFGDPEGP